MNAIPTDDPIKVTKVVGYASTALAAAALLAGATLRGSWSLAIVVAALAILAFVTIARDWGRPLGSVEFAGFVLLAGFEMLQQAPAILGLLGVTAALVAWDLHSLRARLADVAAATLPDALLRKHLLRLGIVAVLGLALGTIALLVRIDYGIGAIVGLAILLVVGLGRVVSYLRRESD